MKLSGIRVLDLSRFLPGPWIGLTMADHGAEVIRIESLEGEPTRRLGPPLKGRGETAGYSAYFRNTQRGKRYLALNLKAPEGREIFLRLAEQSDVVIDSFRPGVMARLGLGYDEVRARAPRIVYCSLSAFGQSGPLAQRPSHDLGAQAITGVLSLGQSDGRPPALPALPMADIALGSAALIGILMALLRREKTGEGDYLDCAMVDALMSWTPHILSSVLAEGRAPDLPRERLYGGAAFYNVYRTKDDRYLVLSGAEMNFVENLLNALGRPDLIALCREPWGPAQDPVKAFLAETFATKTRDEWDRWLADKGVCYAPVLDLHEAWHADLLRSRGMVVTGEDGVEGLGTPIRFREEPGDPTGPVGPVGQHNDEILERLGYDEAARAKLKAAGVI
ncbi:MAG TPA: CoA transferase [Burkholderiales bacterium]|nr:CoA transferase [Burkholderiales bacterium]